MMEGDDREAVRLFRDSLALNRDLGRAEMFPIELANLAACERRLGNLGAAAELALESLRLSAARNSSYMLPYNLIDSGGLALAMGHTERGTKLLAAGAAAFEATGAAMDPGVVRQYDDDRRHAQRELGDRFETLWAEGATMDLSTAVAFALEVAAHDQGSQKL